MAPGPNRNRVGSAVAGPLATYAPNTKLEQPAVNNRTPPPPGSLRLDTRGTVLQAALWLWQHTEDHAHRRCHQSLPPGNGNGWGHVTTVRKHFPVQPGQFGVIECVRGLHCGLVLYARLASHMWGPWCRICSG